MNVCSLVRASGYPSSLDNLVRNDIRIEDDQDLEDFPRLVAERLEGKVSDCKKCCEVITDG